MILSFIYAFVIQCENCTQKGLCKIGSSASMSTLSLQKDVLRCMGTLCFSQHFYKGNNFCALFVSR